MATKVGGGPKLSLINPSAVIDPSLYSYDGQKRSLDNGGKHPAQPHANRAVTQVRLMYSPNIAFPTMIP